MFPVAEEVYDKLVSMPLHAEMNQDDIGKVTQAVERLRTYHT
jgi:dTDP-4-amino-4,6-dideoxygalactose transaminase